MGLKMYFLLKYSPIIEGTFVSFRGCTSKRQDYKDWLLEQLPKSGLGDMLVFGGCIQNSILEFLGIWENVPKVSGRPKSRRI